MTERAQVLVRNEEFQGRLTALVDEFKDAIAPDWDKTADTPCYHEEDCECVPNEHINPTEFILVVNWTDFDQNRNHVTSTASDHLMGWQIIGLLEFYRDRLRG